MNPLVVLHNGISIDGRIDAFAENLGLYYDLASRFDADVHLIGSETILADPNAPPTDASGAEPIEFSGDPDSVLVIPDSRGRVRRWRGLLEQPYWDTGIALVSETTPDDYLDYLAAAGIDYIRAGTDHVEYTTAFDVLTQRLNPGTILVDSGGTLGGHLLRDGLIDEISVLVHPRAVGGESARPFLRGPNPDDDDGIPLSLRDVATIDENYVWLRYHIREL